MSAVLGSDAVRRPDLEPARLREAFGAFPSGVVAVAAEVDGRAVGLAASSFTPVSLDPPLVSFSVASRSRTWPDLRRAEHLGVTILADHQGAVCRRLAGAVGQRFDGVAISVTAAGAIGVVGGLARFDCTVDREIAAGDHTIVLLRLEAVEHARDDGGGSSPLVFHRSAFGRLSGPSGTATPGTV